MADEYVLLKMGIITLEWPTILFSLFLFLIVLFCLNKLLFAPVLKTISARKDVESEHHRSEHDFRKKINDLNADYRERLETIKSQVSDTRTKLTEEANQQAALIINKAKDSCSQRFDQIEKEVEQQFETELKKAKVASLEISSKLLAKISL